MKTKSYTNKKGEIEYNILLENVVIIWTHLDEPDEPSETNEFGDGKYGCTCLLPKKDLQTITLSKIFKDLNPKIKVGSKYYPLKEKDLNDIQEKMDNEEDENKKENYKKYLEDARDNVFMKVGSKFEVKIINSVGEEVKELEKVQFNNQVVNLQFKLIAPTGKSYFSRFLQGVQLKEVKLKEASNLMFDTVVQEDVEEDLPFN